MYYIYKITCINNWKVYIGSTRYIDKRFKQHLDLLSDGVHHNKEMQADYNLYGKHSFRLSILYHSFDEEKITLEKQYIYLYRVYCELYNISFTKSKLPIVSSTEIPEIHRPKIFISKECGKIVSEYRKKIENERDEFAEKLDCTIQQLIRIEHGNYSVPHKLGLKLSSVCGKLPLIKPSKNVTLVNEK